MKDFVSWDNYNRLIWEVKDDGIYIKKEQDIGFGDTLSSQSLFLPKEAFVEAYKKWIEEPLVKECEEYKKQLESDKR